MDTSRDQGPEAIRIAQIRADIEGARGRIAEAIDALGYKADLPGRLGDVLASTASGIVSRALGRLPSSTSDGGGSTVTQAPVDTRVED